MKKEKPISKGRVDLSVLCSLLILFTSLKQISGSQRSKKKTKNQRDSHFRAHPNQKTWLLRQDACCHMTRSEPEVTRKGAEKQPSVSHHTNTRQAQHIQSLLTSSASRSCHWRQACIQLCAPPSPPDWFHLQQRQWLSSSIMIQTYSDTQNSYMVYIRSKLWV